ncbi:MAG: lysophospholipid acyltransferase family protein [Pirellula sp.]
MYPTTTALTLLIISLTAAFAAIAWGLIRPGRYNTFERILYAPVYALSRVLWRVDIEWLDAQPQPGGTPEPAQRSTDRERLLKERMTGGAVLVANHRCSIDPFFVQLIAGCRVHWMVAGEYFKSPLLGDLLRAYEAIPTNRGGSDTNAIKRAIALAASGRFVGMFPEGRINRTDQPLLSIRPGAATVALRAGVPLVPLWIEGAPVGPTIFSPLFRAAKIRVIVGQPDSWGLQRKQEALQHRAHAPHAAEGSRTEPSDASNDVSVAHSAPPAIDNDDRSIAEAWIHRVMQTAVQQSGRSADTIALAGKHWLQE